MEAKSIWAMASGDDELLLESLIDAERWREAHNVLVTSIAPKWFLAQNKEGKDGVLWNSLYSALEDFEQHQDGIPPEDWRVGGGMYLSYLRLNSKAASGEAADDDTTACISDLAEAVDRSWTLVCSNRAERQKSMYLQFAALARISADVASWGGDSIAFSIGKRALKLVDLSSSVHSATALLAGSVNS